MIIHLESLNNAFLYQNSEMFPNIMKLKERSLYFSNFYSTATSTIMTVSDLMYGSDSFSDVSADLEHFRLSSQSFLWLEHMGRGFARKQVIMYPELDWKYDRINMKKIVGKTTTLIEKRRYANFKEEISDAVRTLDGDFLYIYDWSSLYMKEDCEDKYTSWSTYYLNQYKRIDDTLGYVWNELEKYKKLEQTVIIAYGDHGDDMYSYGKNKGFTHAIAPYPNIIRTPLMIYKHDLPAQVNTDLICTFDIGNIVKSICEEKELKINRQYVFSRNLFPLQKSEVLEKSYAVTDGKYLLLVSSRGLELYACRFMAHSNFNLLNWFTLKRDGIIQIKKIKGMHFKRMVNDQKEDIEQHFYKLRKLLYKELKKKVDAGLLQENVKRWFAKIYYNSAE